MGILGPVTLARYDDWDWGLGVLLGGAVNGIQTFLPRLLAHGEGGHIVNTSSMAGVLPIGGAAIYITAKAALIGLSEALRSELAGEGIGVSAFCPGPVQTNIREGGRMRPERYGDSGYTELERELEERPNSPLWMDPLECGERVLAGIRRDDLYIFTHREFREGADERFRAMLESFPEEPLNEERADEIRYLLSNPIFREVLERRSERASSLTVLLTVSSRSELRSAIARLASERMRAATPRARWEPFAPLRASRDVRTLPR